MEVIYDPRLASRFLNSPFQKLIEDRVSQTPAPWPGVRVMLCPGDNVDLAIPMLVDESENHVPGTPGSLDSDYTLEDTAYCVFGGGPSTSDAVVQRNLARLDAFLALASRTTR